MAYRVTKDAQLSAPTKQLYPGKRHAGVCWAGGRGVYVFTRLLPVREQCQKLACWEKHAQFFRKPF